MDTLTFQRTCLRWGYGTAPMIKAWIFANPKADYTEADCVECAGYCQNIDWQAYGRPRANKEMRGYYELEDRDE